jgi:hypothetical protein
VQLETWERAAGTWRLKAVREKDVLYALQDGKPLAAPAANRAQRILVKPVFLVSNGAEPPDEASRALLWRHMRWCRERYRELLLGRDTFELADDGQPTIVRGQRDAAFYLASPGQGSEAALLELFEHDHLDRFSCPYVYVVLFCGTGEQPKGGGAPINGGANCGGGIVILAADNLRADAGFQACLQHELGHAFGLPHADAWGWDMHSSDSLMSYNPEHRTHGFEPSATPGRLLPEELRLLDVNERVFPSFQFDAARDVPAGYAMNSNVPVFPPIALAGQPEFKGSWDGK